MSEQKISDNWRAVRRTDLAPDESYWSIECGCGYFHHSNGREGFDLTGFISRQNAILMAAAPDLLAACVQLIDAPHQEHFITRLNDEEMRGIDMIKAAIAKATGATP